MIQEAISQVIDRKNLSEKSARAVMSEMMSGSATPAQMGSFLTAMRMKGETEDELRGFVTAMRHSATKIVAPHDAVDLCGTGGDGRNTFNISTVAALVVAGAGVPVAKHGNRAVSSRSGSADLLSALGVPHDLPPQAVQHLIDKTGFGFMFAPVFHSSMRNVMLPRREIGVRTVFNILGPMSNPAGVKRQLIGVYDPALAPVMARTLGSLGTERAMVVHSQGMDEISTVGDTKVVELENGHISEYRISPSRFGLDLAEPDELAGGGPTDNARVTLSILKGEGSARADVVALNAAAGIYVSGKCGSMTEGLDIARDVVRTGRAMQKLKEHAAVARALETARQSSEPLGNLREKKVLMDVFSCRCPEIAADLIERISSMKGGPEVLDRLDSDLTSHPNILTMLVLRRMKHVLSKDDPAPDRQNRASVPLSTAVESHPALAVIAEYKPSSPGAAPLQVPPDPGHTATVYAKSGVVAVSALVENEFFGGSPQLFSELRSRLHLPMLFKDFVTSDRQVRLADALGADAVLLIAKALNCDSLEKMIALIQAKGMEPLVELHDDKDLQKLMDCSNSDSVRLAGINSRDLRTLGIDRTNQMLLASKVPSYYLRIAESGVKTPLDVRQFMGYDGVLIGSMFMQAEDLELTVSQTVAAALRVRQ